MKIVVDNGIYIQKKDLELIFRTTKDNDILKSILKKYKINVNKRDIDFMFFENEDEISLLNNFWFVINYSDIIDLNDLEIAECNFADLQRLRELRVSYDENKFLPKNKVYDSLMDCFLDQMSYFNYIPSKNEAKNYPLDFQLLFNKVRDVHEIANFKRGISAISLPEEVYKPVIYSKKQLQQIYYEVLCEELTFEELKLYEKQLYCIFSRMDYTPEILNIIQKIMLINRNNTVDFINDDLLDLIMHIEGKDGKLEESTLFLMYYLYTIGYNKFNDFNSKIVFENDLKILKTTFDYMTRVKLEEKHINKLAKYNYILAEILKPANKCNMSQSKSRYVDHAMANMMAFVYINPDVINYDFDFLCFAYNYVSNNIAEFVDIIGINFGKVDFNNEAFIEGFNKTNALMIYLYNEKYKKGLEKAKVNTKEPAQIDESQV